MLFLTAVAFFSVAPIASSASATTFDPNLSTLWTAVLETPSAQNPFGSGGPSTACWDLGNRTISPFGPSTVPSCAASTGTWLYIVPSSFECSTFEGNGTTEAVLRKCAEDNDAQVKPTVTIDGKAALVAEVETPLLHLVLPPDNLFGDEAGTPGLSVAHGWVTLLPPLPPGTHTVVFTPNQTTKIIVKPGR
jgi:hypothetical protein